MGILEFGFGDEFEVLYSSMSDLGKYEQTKADSYPSGLQDLCQTWKVTGARIENVDR